MKNFIMICLFGLCLIGCTKPDAAKEALEAAGYKDVNITGYVIFGCDKHDDFHTGFTAIGQNGKPVTGVVCGGIFKGSTIRTD